MAETPNKTGKSKVGILALIGGLIGAAQYLTVPIAGPYHGGLPLELIGSIGGGALLGAAVGWFFQRFTIGKHRS